MPMAKVPESKKKKTPPLAAAMKRTPRPRHGPVGPRYDCDRATGQRNHIKNLGAAHRSDRPPPPASDARARPTGSRRSLTTAGIYPQLSLGGGEAHLAAPHRRSARRRERARPATQRNRRARVAAAPPAPPGPRGTASAPEIAPPGRAAENTKGEDHERPLQPLRDEV